MNQWRSESIELAPSTMLDVTAEAGGVIMGTVVGDGLHLTDMRVTPKQARAIAALLIQGADKCEEIQEMEGAR